MGLLLGLGCLAKWTYPVFVGVPLLLAVRKTRRWTSLLPTVGVAAIIAAPWYVTNFSNVVAFFERGVVAGEGHLSAHPGLMGWLYYPKELILVGLGLPWEKPSGHRVHSVTSPKVVFVPVAHGSVCFSPPPHVPHSGTWLAWVAWQIRDVYVGGLALASPCTHDAQPLPLVLSAS